MRPSVLKALILTCLVPIICMGGVGAKEKLPYASEGLKYGAIYNGKQNMPVNLYGVAADWDKKCHQGRTDFCLKMARATELGEGSYLPDIRVAMGYYIKACEQDDIRACGITVEYLLTGVPGFTDARLAVEHGIRACNDLDAPDACAWLALAKYRGIGGMALDKEGARDLWSWTCDHDSMAGCRMYTNYQWQDDGSPEALDEAAGLFGWYCDEEDQAWACLGYAIMSETTDYAGYDSNQEEYILDDLEWACYDGKGDRLPACAEYGKRLLAKSGSLSAIEDVNIAEGLLSSACNSNIAESCYLLGKHGIDGNNGGGEVTQGEAGYYLRRACDLDYAQGCMDLGYAYRNGRMRKVREGVAAALTDKACRLGNETGCLLMSSEKNKALLNVINAMWIDPALPAPEQMRQAVAIAESDPKRAGQTVGLLMEEQFEDAEWLLGNWFLTGKPGIVSTPDLGNATILIDNAARVGHIEAAKWMGYSHWYGLYGLEEDRQLGENYMLIAAMQNDREAIDYYRSMINTAERERRQAEAEARAAEAAAREAQKSWFAKWAEQVAAQSAASSYSTGTSYSAQKASDSWQRSQSALDDLQFGYRMDYLSGRTSTCGSWNKYC